MTYLLSLSVLKVRVLETFKKNLVKTKARQAKSAATKAAELESNGIEPAANESAAPQPNVVPTRTYAEALVRLAEITEENKQTNKDLSVLCADAKALNLSTEQRLSDHAVREAQYASDLADWEAE